MRLTFESSAVRRTWPRVAAIVLSLASLSAVLGALSCSSTAKEPVAMTAAQKVELGRHLVTICACNDCHTPGAFYGVPDTTRTLSGTELGWEGPWGVSYPRNLTPDMETGIGSWTEDQIVTALRTGQRPDKTLLLPPMPWPMYSHLTDEEVYAVAAYLKSLPPVKHKAPDRIPPGTKTSVARLTFPPPPAWDGMNLPKPAGAPTKP